MYRQYRGLADLSSSNRLVPVVTAGWVRAATSHALVPGDVVVVQEGKASCDMVLLRGSCLVEESMLSGEVSCCVMLCYDLLTWACAGLD